MIDGVAHGDGELDLPEFGAGVDDDVHHLGKLGHDRRGDLRVDAGDQTDALAIVQNPQRFAVGAGNAAQAIVQRLQAVDRNAETEQARGGSRLDHLA